MKNFILCSDCFNDEGLKLDAAQIGFEQYSICSNCNSKSGKKLDERLVDWLAYRFFVWGTLHRMPYGATPLVQYNTRQSTEINTAIWFEPDMRLIEKSIGVGFFYYVPRIWMVGEIEPLKALQEPVERISIIERILKEYPEKILSKEQAFYRIRMNLEHPDDFTNYDSPPGHKGEGRFNCPDLPVMYGSQDLQTCIHECRITVEDELFVATLSPQKNLKLLDLTELLAEENVNEFESLDLALHMLFLAGKHSYDITRSIALAAHVAGYDGIVYPSYFSLLRTGEIPFETSFGFSHRWLAQRRIPQLAKREKSKIVPNIALFGHPIRDGSIGIRCINRLVLDRVEYGIKFGPVGYQN